MFQDMIQKQSFAQRAQIATHPLAKRLFQLMADKQTNLCVNADVTRAEELLHYVALVADQIAVLKTHIDIVEDFTPELTERLTELAEKHNFLIFEDRKFADIGNIVKLQYSKGAYHIADWAHITNAHALPGPGIVEGLKEIGLPKHRGLLLLAQMSSAANLFDEGYVRQTVAMAQAHADFVMGFISQQQVSENPGLVHMTPGVQLEAKRGSLGQQYRSVHQAIVQQGCDVVIVGSGIIQSEDSSTAAKRYRDAAWQAYQECV